MIRQGLSSKENRISYDWWISLRPPAARLILATSKPPAKLCGGRLTLWDSLEVFGAADWTLENLLQSIERQHGFRATLIVQGTKMVYVQAIPTHQKRKAKL